MEYSNKIKLMFRAVELKNQFHTNGEIAKKMGLAYRTVGSYITQYRDLLDMHFMLEPDTQLSRDFLAMEVYHKLRAENTTLKKHWTAAEKDYVEEKKAKNKLEEFLEDRNHYWEYVEWLKD